MDEAKLEEIKSFEEEANKIIDDAKKEYHKVIADADLQGADFFEGEKQKTKEEVKRILAKFKDEGQKEASEILAALGGVSGTIENKANPNRENAVNSIVGFIKNK